MTPTLERQVTTRKAAGATVTTLNLLKLIKINRFNYAKKANKVANYYQENRVNQDGDLVYRKILITN